MKRNHVVRFVQLVVWFVGVLAACLYDCSLGDTGEDEEDMATRTGDKRLGSL
jgi:hypothetical protein